MADLQGSLSVLSLPGLLQLLATERRSGRLQVLDDAGAAVASLWLEEGRVVHATGEDDAGDGSPHDVVAGLLARDEGAFRFDTGAAPPRRTLALTADELLMEAACRDDHARRDATGLPLDAVPVLAPVAAAGTSAGASARFNTLQWRLLASIDGRRDVAALARELGLPETVTARLLAELVQSGVLEVVRA